MITLDKYIAGLATANIRFRYAWIERFGEYNHKHLFIIGERTDKPNIVVMEELSRGQKYAELRIWYVDIEAPDSYRYLKNIPYEYPLPISPVAIAYDGSKYLYVIYNKYNIWRLDLKGVLSDPSGNWWFRLPPCINCNFLGDSRTSPNWRTYFIKPNYLALISTDGLMARMDTDTFVWFYDKAVPPAMPYTKFGINKPPTTQEENQSVGDFNLNQLLSIDFNKLKEITGESELRYGGSSPVQTATGLDNDEIYMAYFGGIGGKVMNIYDKQWDNFYFDTTICRDVLKFMGSLVDQDLWPLFIKRRRLYTANAPGHLFYAWLRIDGLFDVEYQLNDFYQVDEIRVYADYTVINQWQNVDIEVYAIGYGWVKIPKDKFEPIVNEIDWLWDSEYTRQYVRIIPTPSGLPKFQYTKIPPNYIKIDVSYLGQPISKIRVRYKPIESETNYIARINRVEAISRQEILNAFDTADSNEPLEIIKLEPIKSDQEYSPEFAVFVKNRGDYPVKDVKVWVVDNQWVQMTLDNTQPDSWVRYHQDNPLNLGDMNPGDVKKFYIRGMNIDQRPHTQDLVIVGVYPFRVS